MKKGIITVLILSSFFYAIHWYNKPTYVIENNCSIEDIVSVPEAIERATRKMGPYYQYIVETDGTLKVKLDNKWRHLKY